MASDITLAVGDGVRRMTYAELAEGRGISVLAARQLTRRHRWHKQVGNDGFVTVSVPLSALENPQKSAKFPDTASRQSVTVDDTASDAASDAVRAFEAALAILRDQLTREGARADRAEAELEARGQWGLRRRLRWALQGR